MAQPPTRYVSGLSPKPPRGAAAADQLGLSVAEGSQCLPAGAHEVVNGHPKTKQRENAGLGRAWAWKIWYLHIHCLAITIPVLMLFGVYTCIHHF